MRLRIAGWLSGFSAARISRVDSTEASVTIYCRKCGYALVGLSENRCPECGRGFDPGDPRTFLKSARGWRVRWWGKRIALGIGLLVAVCVVAAAAIFGNLYWHWRAEQPIIAAIRQQGGIARVDPLANPSHRWLFSSLLATRLPWHESSGIAEVILGLSPRVFDVEYTSTSLTSADLGVLPALPWLKSVCFVGTRLSDSALGPLSRAERLERLFFARMSLSKEDIACIGRIRGLQLIRLREVNLLDGADLADLRELPALSELSLYGDPIDDGVLQQIGQISTLRRLYIASPHITDEGLRHLAGLAALDTLTIESAQITGSGLHYLKGLPVLRRLTLFGCPVVDDGLESLKDWPSLEELRLNGTRITDAAAKHLAAVRTLTSVSGDLDGHVDWLPVAAGCEEGPARGMRVLRLSRAGQPLDQSDLPAATQSCDSE